MKCLIYKCKTIRYTQYVKNTESFFKFIKLSLVYCLVSAGVYGITIQPFYSQTAFQFNQNLQPEIEEETHKINFDHLKDNSEEIASIDIIDLFNDRESYYTQPYLNTEIKPPIC